uniref:S8 family peptidase n=1 Tax=Avrilella dinanensis TaxID=2008672 RepID=UPI00240A80B4
MKISGYLINFYVKLKSPSDFHVLQSEASRNNVIIFEQNKFMPLWYTLKVTKNTIGSTLEVANRFYETGLFASSQPDFLADDIACSDDPMFGSLWGLHNSSNPDYDINICEAWNITEGENINVAVLDTGIEKTHGDLNANMSPLSFNTETGTSPSQVFGDHGTHCAGIIAAEKDNNTQVVGVAPKAKLMDVSNSLLSTANSRMKRADGINWAWQNGADVISNSWGSTIMYDVIDDAIDNALQNGRDGKGTLIVFASGNDYNNVVSYPANSNPDILAVGSITSSGNRSDFSNYGNQLDVVAPGSNILSTVLNNEIDYNSGTSIATPHVSGVAALILSVNPNLTAKQVQDIIESTAQKIGNYSYTNTAGRTNGDWNEQMGYGLIDAYAAVQMAQLDLYIKDCPTDFGQEPSGCVDFWDSPDIWVRNNQDGQTENQNPVYRPSGTPNYIYVKVRNLSCVPSSGNEKLKIYWAKANTSYAWPDYWNGTAENDQGIPLSSGLPSVDIPVIQPGQEVVVAVPWVVPNPADYSDMEEPWHYCIMARVESE